MSADSAVGSAQRTVRRLITYLLLFALVVIAAVGLSGLLERLLVAGTELATADVAGLARSLAFALIGGPLAALLWWVVWRRLGDETERASVGWGLYLTGMYVLSLILATSNLLSTLTTLIAGQSLQWRPSLATGLVWAAVWVWHRWMSRHPRKRPLDLVDVPTVLGTYIGLVIGVSGAVAALSTLLDAALRGATAAATVGKPWWVSALQSLVWAAGGGLVWWWHWKHDGGRLLRTGFAGIALIAVGVLGAGVLTLGGAGVVLFVLLRLAFDRIESMDLLLEAPGAGGRRRCHRLAGLGVPPRAGAWKFGDPPAGKPAGDLGRRPRCRCVRDRRDRQRRPRHGGHPACRVRGTHAPARRHQFAPGRGPGLVAHLETARPDTRCGSPVPPAIPEPG